VGGLLPLLRPFALAPTSFTMRARAGEKKSCEEPLASSPPPPSHLARPQRLGLLLGQHDALDGPLREPFEDGGDVQGAAAWGGGEAATGARNCGRAEGRGAGQRRRHPAGPQVDGPDGGNRHRQAGGGRGGGGPGGARAVEGGPHLRRRV